MAYEKMSNEQLVSMVINTAHRVSILSESNDLIDLREELMSRLTKRAADSFTAHVACPHCAWLFEVNLPVISG